MIRFGSVTCWILYVGTNYRVQSETGDWFSAKGRLRESAGDRGEVIRLLIDDYSVYDRYHPTTYCLFLIDRAGRLRLRQDRNHARDEEEDRQLAYKVEELLDEASK